jgi:hypothetical protein
LANKRLPTLGREARSQENKIRTLEERLMAAKKKAKPKAKKAAKKKAPAKKK